MKIRKEVLDPQDQAQVVGKQVYDLAIQIKTQLAEDRRAEKAAAASAVDAGAIAKEQKGSKIPAAIRKARQRAIASFKKSAELPP